MIISFRFERKDKEFFTWVLIQGGRCLYETLHANAPKGMPSLPTVLKFQGNVLEPVFEGRFRWQELVEYLRENDLPRVIALSEDGTRITGQIEYDPISNRLVGFAAPLDANGLPDADQYVATGEKAMAAMFDTAPRAHTAYVLMAQPMLGGAKPFCLMSFGTDNRFKAADAVRRWRWLKQCAEHYGIAIVCYSADGDPKILSGMRSISRPVGPAPDNPPEWKEFFDQDLDVEECYVQDTVHIGTNFRTGFCNRGKTYLMGKYCATVAHLKHIMNTTSKLQHGLTESVLNHTDKMNFDAVLRMTDERVLRLLRGPSMEQYSATEMFLTVVRDVLVSYLDEELSAEDRIFRIWRAVFFLRIWREWLLQSGHRLDQCFISTNTFQSIELNAHALIKLLRMLRDGKHPDQFLPHLLGSQQCEQLFRALRSLTTTHATVVNFSMLKMLARVRRVELQSRVVGSVGEMFTFPREENRRAKAEEAAARTSARGGLPSDEDILAQIDFARSEAKNCAALLGMDPGVVEETIPAPRYGDRALGLDVDDDEDDDDVEEPEDADDVEEAADAENRPPTPEQGGVEADDFDPDDVALSSARQAWSAGQDVQPFPPDSPMILYTKPNGVKVPMRKSTYCWLRTRGSHRQSSDRLLRVMDGASAAQRQQDQLDHRDTIVRRESIAQGEWCTFQKAGEEKLRVGQVLAFRYSTGEGRKRLYTLPSAPVAVPDGVEARGLRVVYSWYDVGEDRVLSHITSAEECEIETYKFSIPSPAETNGVLKLDPDVVHRL
ncbi:Peptide chain release factor 1 [Frankliniella fusca]|uniref:Peptide chain release factor 1 n=1 Tax=Frankliniella fusca TaxID=407009 RepID=A0AAE1GY63_9NEOP|nr:Peptide chain release factor 1 [Frankliniella fusca]